MPTLRRRLRRAFRHAPDSTIADAIDEAIVDYALRPYRFDPRRDVPLEAFLYQASCRNVLDALRTDRRRRDREVQFLERYAFHRPMRPREYSGRDIKRRLHQLVANEYERKALYLWMKGYRGSEGLASALRVDHLPISEQQREVKRFFDRLVRRVARIAQSVTTPERRKSHS